MSADNLISKLDKVRRTGPGTFLACCPAHDDKSPSLAIRELSDGRILLHCFAGCEVESVLSTIGLTFTDLFPERECQYAKSERHPFPAGDVLRTIGFEALVVATASTAMLDGECLSPIDRDRLLLAVARIQGAVGMAFGGNRHA